MSLFSIEDDQHDEAYNSGGKKPYCPDLHLQTAIRPHNRKLLRDYLSNQDSVVTKDVEKVGKQLLTHPDFKNVSFNFSPEKKYGMLLNPQISDTCPMDYYRREMGENIRTSAPCVEAACSILKIYPDKSSTLDDLLHFEIPDTLLHLYIYRNFWDGIRDSMKEKQIDSSYGLKNITYEDTTIVGYCSAYFLFLYIDELWHVFDYEQVLMLVDTNNSRYLSMFYLELEATIKTEFTPSSHVLQQIYSWGDRILESRGNSAYDVIKDLEPTVIGSFLARYDPLPLSHNFLQQILDNHEDATDKVYLKELVSILKDGCTHENHYMELFGVYRHFGHPTVDEEAGMRSMYDNTTVPLPMDEIALQEVSGAFNRSFIIEFINVNRRWPKCTLNQTCNSVGLKQLVKTKPLAFSEYESRITLADWHHIEFEQEFIFDDFKDFTILLADKALAPYLEHWYSAFSADLINIKKDPNMRESRRLLIEILSRTDISCEEIRKIIQSRKIPWYWYIVALHSKERELKIKARLFSMLCLEIRLYFSFTEKNLSEQLFRYIPNQSMTMSEAELIKKLIDMSARTVPVDFVSGTSSRKLHGVISLDFTKFNQRWRKKSTDYIFSSFDRLFGTTNLYTFTHEFFESSYFYLSSHLNPPSTIRKKKKREPLNRIKITQKNASKYLLGSETSWFGQDGGCEGLRQKGWTVIIQSALEAVRFKTGIVSYIIGQGDNQIIIVEIPIPYEGMDTDTFLKDHPVEVEDALKQYLAELKKMTMGIGMDLKLEESWISTRLINYGKELIIDGSMMGGGLKRAGRTYQEVNDIHPTIQNRISSIFTSAQSTGQKTFDNICPYYLSLIESLNLISRETRCGTICGTSLQLLLTGLNVKCDAEFKRFLLAFPLELGGLPIPPFLDMVYRGHPDPLSNILYWLKIYANYNSYASSVLEMITSGILDSDTVDYLYLIMDPQSVNFRKPVKSSNRVKSILESTVKTINRNKHIATMLHHFNKAKMDELVKYLMTVRPVVPRVLNEILRLSPIGCMLSFYGMFTDMRTMKLMLSAPNATHLVNALKQADLDLFSHVAAMYKICQNKSYIEQAQKNLGVIGYRDLKKKIDTILKCTYKASFMLRSRTWKLKIREVTMPVPFEQFSLHRVVNGVCPVEDCDDRPFVSYVFQKEAAVSNMEGVRFQRGYSRPYLGSGTTEKRSGPTLIYPKSEKPLRAAQNLHRLNTWACDPSVTNTLKIQIDSIRIARCDAEEIIIVATGGVCFGGGRTHRLSDSSTKHEGRPSIRVNIHSRIHISSDKMGIFSISKENYPLLFQGIFLAALNSINHQELFHIWSVTDENIVFHQHLDCMDCMEPIIEPLLKSNAKPVTIKPLKKCPLLFSSVDTTLTNIPLQSFERTDMVTPCPGNKHYMHHVCCALAFLLVGEIHTMVTPLVRSPSNYVSKIGTYASLTVGLFKLIDLSLMLNYIALIFLCDFLPEAVYRMKKYSCTMSMSFKMVLAGLPDMSWDVLKPYLCTPEVVRTLSTLKLLQGTSSEMFITGRGLGNALNRAIWSRINSWEQHGFSNLPNIPFFTTSPGISIQRAMYIWVNQNILVCGWKSPTILNEIIIESRKNFEKAVSTGALNIQQLILSTANITSHNVSMHQALRSRRFILSKVGCEPWLAPGYLLEHLEMNNSNRISKFTFKVPSVDHNLLSAIRNIMSTIGRTHRHAFSNVTSLPYTREIVLEAFQEPRGHARIEHSYRLVGRYSTALLKYLSVLADNDLSDASSACNLAEGAGGLSRMAIKLFGCIRIIYNSLFSGKQIIDHRSRFFKPAELTDCHAIDLIGPEICYETGGDLTSPVVIASYRNILSQYASEVKLITMDAESPTDQPLLPIRLCEALLLITEKASPGTIVVMKTFCGNRGVFEEVCSLFSTNFPQSELITSSFSAIDNTEVFLKGIVPKHYARKPAALMTPHDRNTIAALVENRRTSRFPFDQLSYSKLQDLYLFIDHLGIPLNIHIALHTFLGYIAEEDLIATNVLRACSETQEVIVDTLHTRFSIITQLSKTQHLTTSARSNLRLGFSDHREIISLLLVYINTLFLQDFLANKRPDTSLLLRSWDLVSKKKQILFRYSVTGDTDLWKKRFLKSFYKILGHYRIMNEWQFTLPYGWI